MQELIGNIIKLERIVVDGNTLHIFTLMKTPGKHMEDDDEIYGAVFVEKPGLAHVNGQSLGVSDVALALTFGSDFVKVTVDFDGDVPVQDAPALNLVLPVIAVETIVLEQKYPD